MDRQEPVIDLERSERNAKTLTDRIRLTWREVRDLMTDAPDDLPKEPTLGTAPAAERASKTPAADRAAAPVAATVATSATAANEAADALDAVAAPAETSDVATAAATVAEAPQPVAPAPREPEPLRLTVEEKEAIVKRIAPQVEAAVRSALRDTLDMVLANALTRVKSDMDRSLGNLIAQAVAQELRRLDVSDIVRR